MVIGGFLGIELIYSFIIIAISLIIYFETKGIYRLTAHKSLKYFRLTFLFFGLAYLLKFLSSLLLFEKGFANIGIYSFLVLLITMYAYLMAGVYLILSVSWKESNKKIFDKEYIWHILAIVLTLFTILTRIPTLYILFQLLILIYGISLMYSLYKKSRKKKEKPLIYVVYPLLLVFWVINILDLFITRFYTVLQILIYLVSIALFLLILYRVIKAMHVRK